MNFAKNWGNFSRRRNVSLDGVNPNEQRYGGHFRPHGTCVSMTAYGPFATLNRPTAVSAHEGKADVSAIFYNVVVWPNRAVRGTAAVRPLSGENPTLGCRGKYSRL